MVPGRNLVLTSPFAREELAVLGKARAQMFR